MRIRDLLAGLPALACVMWATPAQADAVTTWNEIAVRAVTVGRPGTTGLIDLAVVHAAIHDAVQAFDGQYEPFRVRIAGAGGSLDAAVAAAAYGVLVGMYPAQQPALESEYTAFLEAHDLEHDAGLAVGQAASAALLAEHRPVPNPPPPPYVGSAEPGAWRPTPSYLGGPPPAFAPMAFVYLVTTRPFTLSRPSQFRPPPPPPLQSERYARDYEEVRLYGARFNSLRSPEETDVARFWTDNYVAQPNRLLRAVAEDHLATTGDTARLFALAHLAMADALISCWETKYHYNFWRPVTAIQLGATDRNPHTVPDPDWQPLIDTPNYPEYSSGANSLIGALTGILERVFGTDELPISVTSNAPNVLVRTRTYERLSDLAQEVVDARILLGIHFRIADEEARRQGTRVAHWVFTRTLKPVPGGRN